ncbi:unnamed protein product [Triticum turgidum subsp. durum]|uniref:Uncharacterized protein n=1 Tax=Triticum turgidum subsp. durum TaxID=4567 RepID=A0A9R1BEX3_TRITD|nr:unnamed protein product [Triticum turgidum subsp. durum]
MCNMMSLDLKKTLYEVHPSFVELERIKSMSVSDSTLDRLAGKVHALNQEKKQRLRKVLVFAVHVSHLTKVWLQDLGGTLIELWSLTDTPLDEQKCFDHVTSLISVSQNTVMPQGCLSHDLIKKVTVDS